AKKPAAKKPAPRRMVESKKPVMIEESETIIEAPPPQDMDLDLDSDDGMDPMPLDDLKDMDDTSPANEMDDDDDY
ncbi:MAG: hypothetical protein ABI763_05435, partial [Bacteroidota bacterium]